MKKNWNYAVINEYKKSKWFNEKAEDWLKKKTSTKFSQNFNTQTQTRIQTLEQHPHNPQTNNFHENFPDTEPSRLISA